MSLNRQSLTDQDEAAREAVRQHTEQVLKRIQG